MAERRMFAKTIIDSDAFIDMPMSARCLYYDLGMRADDDGFINSPKKIQRMVGASDDDLKLLMAKNFIIPFESGVVVIKHWKIHNYIRNDRYKSTVYEDEMQQLDVKENKAYTLKNNVGIPNDNQVTYQMDTQVRLGKVSIGKDNKECIPKRTHFIKPTKEEIEKYLITIKTDIPINADRFLDYYEAKGWLIGKNKMKDWKAAVRNWGRKKDTPIKPNNDSFDQAKRKRELDEMFNGK